MLFNMAESDEVLINIVIIHCIVLVMMEQL